MSHISCPISPLVLLDPFTIYKHSSPRRNRANSGTPHVTITDVLCIHLLSCQILRNSRQLYCKHQSLHRYSGLICIVPALQPKFILLCTYELFLSTWFCSRTLTVAQNSQFCRACLFRFTRPRASSTPSTEMKAII